MIKGESFTVEKGGVRLDAALFAHFPSSTKPFCREACEGGCVSVNGRPGFKGLKLRGGERVDVAFLAEASDNRVSPDASIDVDAIFEDDSLIAIDKPAGMPVQPISWRERGTLMNGVVAQWPAVAEVGDQPMMAGALHRIDADTSGLVLVAKTRAVFEAMRAQFAEQSVEKTYYALVEGSYAVGGTLENELVHDPDVPYCRMIDVRRARSAVRSAPMRAVTKFTPVAWSSAGTEPRTLLEVKIRTGVTHQIRAQLALAGMHIVNDRLYGAFAVENQVGHCLHAFSARFLHPVSGDEMELRTDYPRWTRTL